MDKVNSVFRCPRSAALAPQSLPVAVTLAERERKCWAVSSRSSEADGAVAVTCRPTKKKEKGYQNCGLSTVNRNLCSRKSQSDFATVSTYGGGQSRLLHYVCAVYTLSPQAALNDQRPPLMNHQPPLVDHKPALVNPHIVHTKRCSHLFVCTESTSSQLPRPLRPRYRRGTEVKHRRPFNDNPNCKRPSKTRHIYSEPPLPRLPTPLECSWHEPNYLAQLLNRRPGVKPKVANTLVQRRPK